MKVSPHPHLLFLWIHPLLVLPLIMAHHGGGGSILFSTVGRSDYFFDVFTLPADQPPSLSDSAEIRITDGESVNFNGYFPPSSSSVLRSIIPNQTLARSETEPLHLVYVTERDGVSNLFYDVVYGEPRRRGSAIEFADRVQVPLLAADAVRSKVSMQDRPSLAGDCLVYVATYEDAGEPRTSWNAVYSTDLRSGSTRRLTPYGVADFSPAVSPSGEFTAVASYGPKGWDGAHEELRTDIYVFLTRDGTQRVKVAENGGWPCWADERTLYFHRMGDDRWWSIYRAILPYHGPVSTDSVTIQRVTPPGLHALTPATSPARKNLIAVATRRPDSEFRHVELYDMEKREFVEITRHVSPRTHHYNPFLSPDSSRVGYHRCRGDGDERRNPKLFLQNIKSPVSNLSLFRIDGLFPSVSPTNDRVAYTELHGVDIMGITVMKLDGSDHRLVYPGMVFSTAWDPVRSSVIYTAAGTYFTTAATEVNIISIDIQDPENVIVKQLTTNGGNNAFPAVSPDGKQIVFRFGISGFMNLYIMDSETGEESGLFRLTEGNWTDTMANWSPDGEWIMFSSNRHDPGTRNFKLYLIHPNRTGLRELAYTGPVGKSNHAWFSPDGKRVVFSTDYSGVSADPISFPNQGLSYGELYTVKLDGSDLTRLTHNAYEDGTPVWITKFIEPVDVAWPITRPHCLFQDMLCLNKMPNNNGQVSVY